MKIEWIKSSEMLPAMKKPVLMFNNIMNEIHLGHYNYYANEWCYDANYCCDVKQSITHWQYAPEPPNDN